MFGIFKRVFDDFTLGRIDPKALVRDQKAFERIVYTPIDEAVAELKRRRRNPKLMATMQSILGDQVPQELREGPKLVLHRQLITPNYETLRFVSIADALNMDPLFFEYHDDKFVTENEWKYHLGCMCFYFGKGKKGGAKITRTNIINFNTANGKKISEIDTLWGQNLVEFHHEMFAAKFKRKEFSLFDGSQWYAKNGAVAANYYKAFVALFIQHGILFENFVLQGYEQHFTETVFLPAFIEIWERTHMKPLVVALEPTNIEGDVFWMCHQPETLDYVKNKLQS